MHKSYIFILLISGIICSCNIPKDESSSPDTTVPTGQNIVMQNLTTGSFTDLSTSTIGTSVTTIKISKPNTPVDGIQITIPANSYTSNPTLKISYAEIKSHQFGANFNPISPLISITLDGGYSNQLMSLTIPVTIPAGHIPLGFYVDDVTGKLEGIPFSSIGTNSITLLTRHFLPASKLKSGDINLKSTAPTGANIFISSISESMLKGHPIISTGFKPGLDDWEFVNDGSYIAPKGQCAGQSITAMWYFLEKKQTSGNLFNKFSDNTTLWQDNARGYRFCSVIHMDLDQNNFYNSILKDYIRYNENLDKLKFNTIAGIMLLTGEPCYISIARQNGININGDPIYAGHALVCYQVDPIEGKLYIADPNIPGIGQTIQLVNDKFSPYLAKQNGKDVSAPFPYISYLAKSLFIEWNKIGARYDEITNNSIGNISPNAFPPYTIWVKDKTANFELKDGITVTKDTLTTYVECPTAEEFITENGKRIISSEVYGADGQIKSKQSSPGVKYWSLSTSSIVILTPGTNKLGYAIIGWKPNELYNNSTERVPLFIDFKWITINNIPLIIEPNPLSGEINKSCSWTAKTKGTAPKSAKYIWDFGDGSAQLTNQNDSTASYTYTKEGTFNIKVELYDNSTNKKVTEASSIAKIAKANTNSVTDIDGNSYTTIIIGTQTWMASNLKTTKYSDGTSIVNVTESGYNTATSWAYGLRTTGAYCWFNNDISNKTSYGALYNWYTVNTGKLCPIAWHVPSDADWTTLTTFLGEPAGSKLKATTGWQYNGNGTNSSGLTCLPGGGRSGANGTFNDLGSYSYFWSSTASNISYSWVRRLDYGNGSVLRQDYSKLDGVSVRCLKD